MHYAPRSQKLLSNPVPSHWSWQRGGGVSAKKHFVIINVSESVSKAFLESFRGRLMVVSSTGATTDPHLSAPQKQNGTGPLVLVWGPDAHRHTHMRTQLMMDVDLGLHV